MARPTKTITALVCAVVLGACGSSTQRHGAAARVRDHATTAGDVMTRVRGPLPARAVALSVTGHGADDTIDALAATGTTWRGSVTLRIDVRIPRQNGSYGSTEDATGCFRYTFAYPRTSDWGKPHEIACGNRHAIDLTHPPLPAGVDSATERSVQAAVDRLAPDRRSDPTALRAALRSAVGPDYTIEGGTQGSGAFVWVRYGDQCLSVDTTTANAKVSPPRHGNDCFGG